MSVNADNGATLTTVMVDGTLADDGVSTCTTANKKRSISMDNTTATTTEYGSFTREELILALRDRDHRLAKHEECCVLETDISKNKRVKVSIKDVVPSPCSTVSSSSSSSNSSTSLLDDVVPVCGGSKTTGSAPKTTAARKKERTPVAIESPVTTLSELSEAKVEHFRKFVHQGIKSQITWRPSCKTGTARFVYACMCNEATFRVFLNLGAKDKTKGGKFSVDAFQKDVLCNVLMVRIRYGYLSLNGDVRVSYNKGLGEMKITGTFGV